MAAEYGININVRTKDEKLKQLQKTLTTTERKVKALEKIANSVDALTLWYEEIDKEEWGPRMEWYLSLWKDKYIDGEK